MVQSASKRARLAVMDDDAKRDMLDSRRSTTRVVPSTTDFMKLNATKLTLLHTLFLIIPAGRPLSRRRQAKLLA